MSFFYLKNRDFEKKSLPLSRIRFFLLLGRFEELEDIAVLFVRHLFRDVRQKLEPIAVATLHVRHLQTLRVAIAFRNDWLLSERLDQSPDGRSRSHPSDEC